MVMKVGNINPIVFKASPAVTKPDNTAVVHPQTKELSASAPDYAVYTPQKYKSLGATELSNGLKVYSYKLANGHRVTVVPMEGSPAVVKNYVNVGSMNETDDIKGISHFLEHMAFNGTTGENGYIKLNTGDSFKKIDSLGGWTNASTNYALTDYVNSTPMLEEKDLEEQIKIIAGMTEDLALTPEMIEKEKGPVCSEINMIMDNPQTILMDQTVRTLFNIKSSADELVGGSTKHIKDLTREKVKAYYDKYYTPDNMNLVVTGDVEPNKVIELVSKNFRSTKTRSGKIYEEKISPLATTVRKDFITDKATSTEIMLGFAGPKNNDTKSKIIFDILTEHLDSTDIGISKELKKINANGGMGLEKISTNPYNPTMIFYALNCAEENSEIALKVLFDKISNLKAPSEEKLNIIKERLLQSYKNGLEYSLIVNDVIGNSIIDGDFEELANYENILKGISSKDVEDFISNHLNLNKSAISVVHPKTDVETINNNHIRASKLSFKARKNAVNPNKITEKTLENNYKIGFYQTNNDNMYFDLNLRYTLPKDITPATREVFYEVLGMGTLNNSEDEFRKFQEDNNLNVSVELTPQKLNIIGYSNQENFNKTVEKAKELLYTPRITDEEVNKAIARLKDYLERTEDSANRLYIDYEAQNNPLHTSKAQLLKDLEKVTTDDIRKLHQHILENSNGTIAINTPTNNINMQDEAMKAFGNLAPVEKFEYKRQQVYVPNNKPLVLSKEKAVSQADIAQVFKFEYEDNTKERAMMEILNTILSSSSIGLFNTLREKEHLAYSVYSNIDRLGDCAELSCHILTTTDNKELGEISYDNVQKSINGFNRQIGALLNSEYTDTDLESAKRMLKARLLNKEGTPSKLNALNSGLNSKEGLDFENQLFNEIDKITRADIDAFARKAFNNPPVYSIVASKDTLEANKEYLQTLEN